MSKYGLNLRQPQKKQPARPPLATPLGFSNDDDDDVEKEIARQATKNKALKDIEEQQKKALEEDPTVFDYDGVYDKMKEKIVRPLVQDREARKPKYIQNLIQKAKEREQFRDIAYERKLAKERSKDDHLFADKDKFVTEAYRRKLAEREKQMELERLRELQEEREDVTKKKDFLLDFYSNLDKNVAYGAKDAKGKKHEDEARVPETRQAMTADPLNQRRNDDTLERAQPSPSNSSVGQKNNGEEETSDPPDRSIEPLDVKLGNEASLEGMTSAKDSSSASEPKPDHHKRTQDALTAAKERFLARKRAKDQ